MTTPEGPPHGSPGEQGTERPEWGRPPAGGWGGAAPDRSEQTRSWSETGADPDATRVEQPGVWGSPPAAAPGSGAPAWAQQPPPAGGWNVPPGGAYPPQPGGYPGQQQPYPGQQQWAGGGQAPQWGPGYPPLPDVSRAPGRSRTPLIVGAVVVVLLGIGAVLAFVTPGFLNSTVFDQAALQSGVQRVLTDDYGYPVVGEVVCGDPAQGPIPVRAGDTFTCATTIDGVPATVPVRITSGAGDYEVSRPPA